MFVIGNCHWLLKLSKLYESILMIVMVKLYKRRGLRSGPSNRENFIYCLVTNHTYIFRNKRVSLWFYNNFRNLTLDLFWYFLHACMHFCITDYRRMRMVIIEVIYWFRNRKQQQKTINMNLTRRRWAIFFASICVVHSAPVLNHNISINDTMRGRRFLRNE